MTICLQQLIKHIEACPFGWVNGLTPDGKIFVHKNTTQENILSWFKKLEQLTKYVKQQELSVLDISDLNQGRSTRSM